MVSDLYLCYNQRIFKFTSPNGIVKAAVFNEHGSASKMEVIEVDTPQNGPSEILIEVGAFALNRLDIWTREGLPNLDLSFPHVGGSDFAGVVREVGQKVDGINIGDRVVVNPGISCGHCLSCRSGEISLCKNFKLLGEHVWGGAAEYAIAPASNVMHLPQNVSNIDAAATALTALTTYRMLRTKAQVRPGEKVLVTGSGGGIGTMAVQLARELGAEVFAVTSTSKKMDTAKELGATIVINYKEQADWSKLIWEKTDKYGVDVVIDSSGQAVFESAMRSLAKGGRYVTCGATTGRNVQLNLARLFWKQISVLGSTMASHREFEEVMYLFFAGRIHPVIDSVFSLEEIVTAHERLENPDHMGKIVISM